MNNFTSDISGEQFPLPERVSAKSLRTSLFDLIRKEHPGFSADSYLSMRELNHFREKYVTEYMGSQLGELTALEQSVLRTLSDKSLLTATLDGDDQAPITTGQRLADNVATFGGSWTFIISFGSFLLIWISFNVFVLATKAFDPFPFILLNLILSCLAAIQAPIIMMSQNRQEEKDRERSKNDYMVNLKSELELRILHEKIDHMMIHQQQELIEIQKVQMEMMEDIIQRIENKS